MRALTCIGPFPSRGVSKGWTKTERVRGPRVRPRQVDSPKLPGRYWLRSTHWLIPRDSKCCHRQATSPPPHVCAAQHGHYAAAGGREAGGTRDPPVSHDGYPPASHLHASDQQPPQDRHSLHRLPQKVEQGSGHGVCFTLCASTDVLVAAFWVSASSGTSTLNAPTLCQGANFMWDDLVPG